MTRWWLPDELEHHRDHVTFTGWLTPNELRDWYRKADILVVPSWYEPFGMVILEGMLHGLAVAAADVGGPSEILSHEQTGLALRGAQRPRPQPHPYAAGHRAGPPATARTDC